MSSLSLSLSFSFSFSFFKAKEEKKDLITSLPNDILRQIFSFVPTKYAVATSALSRQWRDLWRPSEYPVLLPHLDFSDVVIRYRKQRTPNCRTLFINFVDNVLRSFNLAGVTRVSFSCRGSYGSWRINEWLREACMPGNNIVELQVYLNYHEVHPIRLPFRVVTSTSLVVLKLNANVKLDLHLHYDGITIFPSLKVLHIFVHNQRDLDLTTRLYSRCPVLEDLFLESMTPGEPIGHGNIVRFEVSSATLKRLRIELAPPDVFNNIFRYLAVIKAENLEWLRVSPFYTVFYAFHQDPDRANFCIGHPSLPSEHYDYNYEYVAFESLKELSKHVKSLSLCGRTMRLLSFAIGKQLEDGPSIPIFTRLKNLELRFSNYRSWSILPNILECSRKLEFLALEKEILDGDQFVFDIWPWREPEENVPVPVCMLYRLKQVVIKGFQGKQYELTAVQFLLRNALVLEKMIICAPPLPADEEMMLSETIFGYQKGSEACKVFLFADGALLEF